MCIEGQQGLREGAVPPAPAQAPQLRLGLLHSCRAPCRLQCCCHLQHQKVLQVSSLEADQTAAALMLTGAMIGVIIHLVSNVLHKRCLGGCRHAIDLLQMKSFVQWDLHWCQCSQTHTWVTSLVAVSRSCCLLARSAGTGWPAGMLALTACRTAAASVS